MKRLVALFCLLTTLAAAQSPGVYDQMTAAERAAAGIAQLTPAQQAALEAAVARIVRGAAQREVAAAREQAQAEAAAAARQEVEQVRVAAQAEQSAAVQRAREQAQAESAAASAAAVRAAREQAETEARAERQRQKIAEAGLETRAGDEAIRTRLRGDFRGWEGRTTFTLENGQVWQQTDGENRFFPKMTDPEVVLEPNRLFGWKMILVKSGLWIRVRRVR